MKYNSNLGSLVLETLLLTIILDQWLSKDGLWSSIIKIVQKLGRNISYQAPFQIY